MIPNQWSSARLCSEEKCEFRAFRLNLQTCEAVPNEIRLLLSPALHFVRQWKRERVVSRRRDRDAKQHSKDTGCFASTKPAHTNNPMSKVAGVLSIQREAS